jgi:transposase
VAKQVGVSVGTVDLASARLRRLGELRRRSPSRPSPAAEAARAALLDESSDGLSEEEIASRAGVGVTTVRKVRRELQATGARPRLRRPSPGIDRVRAVLVDPRSADLTRAEIAAKAGVSPALVTRVRRRMEAPA